MNKDNKNVKNVQLDFQADLERERDRWLEQEENLKAQQAALGYGHLSPEEFIKENPDLRRGQTEIDQFLALQTDFKLLLSEKDTLWWEQAIDREFNKKHAIVSTGQTYVLTERDGIMGFTLESRNSFVFYYEDEMITLPNGKKVAKSVIWLKSPRRRKYKEIVFDPTTVGPVNGNYNIWKGFAKLPVKGNCAKYWNHVEKNICRGNQETYRYVRKWLAYIFQHPDRVHTALVLCGSQGVGKNSFVEPLGILLGQHYVLLSNLSELISNFNFHLKSAVLIHANEAFWGGNKQEVGTLKAMITEETCLIEGKGKDRIMVRNYKHVILSSNEDWPVHLDPDDRRFLVLRVGEEHKEDLPYFKALHDELINDGYEALLYDLLHEDVSDFNPRKLPHSEDAFDIKIRSADSAHKFIYSALDEETFDLGAVSNSGWDLELNKAEFYAFYGEWCTKNGARKLDQTHLSKVLKKLIPSIKDYRPSVSGKRTWFYRFPSLQQARAEFCKVFKADANSVFGGKEAE